ncbi:hypothetical protein [Paenibacillus sp. CF384]|uniref:hypothetical protein n=1 Tax=Paenibacillus sp. CF384 TaxID=1884382 RepID=UPI000894235B|nr:hypothetical protein [Paenibacillus sp. CF384]SDX45618.1 hypothetical protein SAMN05518855_101479 [Paenibacillus sp. CF384]
MTTNRLRTRLAILGTAAALILTAGTVYANSAEIAIPSSDQLQAQHEQKQEHWKHGDHGKGREHREARKLEHLQKAAVYFGISTEGKTAEQLQEELKAAIKKSPTKWEKFKAEKKAERLARLQEKAARLGIKTEGKTAEQLREELHAACKEHGMKKDEKGQKSKSYSAS